MSCAPGSIPTGELDNRRSGFAVTERGEELVVNGRAGFGSGADGAKYVLLAGSIARGVMGAILGKAPSRGRRRY